jgi:predicted RNase H-like HicB family nuclease
MNAREETHELVKCTDLPGCISQGETEEEAATNLADAVADYISVVTEDHLQKHSVGGVTTN